MKTRYLNVRTLTLAVCLGMLVFLARPATAQFGAGMEQAGSTSSAAESNGGTYAAAAGATMRSAEDGAHTHNLHGTSPADVQGASMASQWGAGKSSFGASKETSWGARQSESADGGKGLWDPGAGTIIDGVQRGGIWRARNGAPGFQVSATGHAKNATSPTGALFAFPKAASFSMRRPARSSSSTSLSHGLHSRRKGMAAFPSRRSVRHGSAFGNRGRSGKRRGSRSGPGVGGALGPGAVGASPSSLQPSLGPGLENPDAGLRDSGLQSTLGASSHQ